jgi:hypothetical protein
MNPLFTQDGDSGQAPRSCTWPLSLLALVDMMTLTRDYAPLLSEPPEQNQWFVMRGTEALPPESFHEVLRRLARGEGPLAVLRESEAEQSPAPWYTLDYRASVSNRATALAVIIGFWGVVVFLGWVIVATVSPRENSGLWQTAYFIAAVALVTWLSLSPRGRARKATLNTPPKLSCISGK